MSRKAISVVKTVFLNCTDHEHDDEENDFHNATCTSFISKRKISKKSLLLAYSKNTNTEWKTFLKVGQMSPTPRDITPFVIEWVPDLLPNMGIGEMTIKFEFGHQKNGQLDTFHQV